MPDWKVTMTRSLNVNGASKAIQADHMVEGTTRDLAIPIGIEELFAREAANGFKLVPQQAIDYWHEKKNTGGMLYEILSELENNWGLTFGIADAAEEVAPPPQNHARTNGHHQQSDELPDLDTMLKHQLQILQDRNGALNATIDKATAERDRNEASIMRIAQFLATTSSPFIVESGALENVRIEAGPIMAIAPAPKKRGRPPKPQPNA
jgi:hypothetical protein